MLRPTVGPPGNSQMGDSLLWWLAGACLCALVGWQLLRGRAGARRRDEADAALSSQPAAASVAATPALHGDVSLPEPDAAAAHEVAQEAALKADEERLLAE